MTVYFIGAGPGAADLITLRGLRRLESSPVCLYAGSLVPRELLASCPADARLVDTANLTLDEIVAELTAAHDQGLDVARLHSGDPSVFSAVAETCSGGSPSTMYDETAFQHAMTTCFASTW